MKRIEHTRLLRCFLKALTVDEAGAAATGLATGIAKVVIFSSFIPLGFRTITWLRSGAWPDLTLSSLDFLPPHVSWPGAQEALVAIYGLPVEVVAVVICGVIYALTNALFDGRRAAKRRTARIA